ncbi:MAG: hypothetical protein ACI8VC_002595 [Candidatus Endobugula sp.]|jgi:hypothetical protein
MPSEPQPASNIWDEMPRESNPYLEKTLLPKAPHPLNFIGSVRIIVRGAITQNRWNLAQDAPETLQSPAESLELSVISLHPILRTLFFRSISSRHLTKGIW